MKLLVRENEIEAKSVPAPKFGGRGRTWDFETKRIHFKLDGEDSSAEIKFYSDTTWGRNFYFMFNGRYYSTEIDEIYDNKDIHINIDIQTTDYSDVIYSLIETYKKYDDTIKILNLERPDVKINWGDKYYINEFCDYIMAYETINLNGEKTVFYVYYNHVLGMPFTLEMNEHWMDARLLIGFKEWRIHKKNYYQ